VGGLARRSALEINAFVRSLSPDKMTYLLIGEPTLLSYVPPNQMRNTLGYREGKLFDSGVGGISQVLRYMPGAEFARLYGQTVLSGLCSGLAFSESRERPDMAQNADELVATVVPSISTGGEARFTCRHNGQETEARVDAADELLARVGGSFKFNPAWLQRQSNLDQQAALDINRRMQEFFRQEAATTTNSATPIPSSGPTTPAGSSPHPPMFLRPGAET
jgi:hypothetical protein